MRLLTGLTDNLLLQLKKEKEREGPIGRDHGNAKTPCPMMMTVVSAAVVVVVAVATRAQRGLLPRCSSLVSTAAALTPSASFCVVVGNPRALLVAHCALLSLQGNFCFHSWPPLPTGMQTLTFRPP